MKRLICLLLIIILAFSLIPVYAVDNTINYFESFEGDHNNASLYDWTGKEDLLYTLEFGTDTVWPSDSKMPPTFKKADRDKILEYGKDPGLGIRKLQALGYTGKGVNVAIVDQPLLLDHTEYKDRDIHYYKINPGSMSQETSSHGPGMTSILVGKNIGVVPQSTLYYFANPTWLGDQKNEADAFNKIIELNNTLAENKKIKVVSLSHCADKTLKNSELLQQAIDKARKSGIIVIDVLTLTSIPVTVQPFKDKDAPENYQISKNFDNNTVKNNPDYLFVPTGGKTIANGGNPEHYFYQTNSGVSSTIPYICGVIAMGLQVDPDLTQEKAISFLKESGNPFQKGKLINPAGFIELVKKNCANPHDVSKDKDFRYFLYNSSSLDESDLLAIKDYTSKFDSRDEAVLIDTSLYKTAIDIYNILKAEKSGRKGSLKGIQILGTSGDIPAFDVKYKIQMLNGIDEGGMFKSDHFYSNFNSKSLSDGISIYEVFDKKLQVDFVPEWPVSRLPLIRGEFSGYIQKFTKYTNEVNGKQIPVVDFSSPIFPSKLHVDDTGILLNRLSNEFKTVNSKSYRLYGNQQGLYPVTTNTAGDFSKESLIKENSAGICNFTINSHGQVNNIDKYIVDYDKNLDKYPDKAQIKKLGDSSSEFRQSLINIDNINTVLSSNYYNLFSRSCLNAWNLDEKNIIHEAMAKGLMITAIANSSVNSNNGIDVTVNLDKFKKNNPAYNYLIYLSSLFSGNSGSKSFYTAKAAYAQEVLKNRSLTSGYGNYQFQLHNVLVQTYLGLLEYNKDKNIPLGELLALLEKPGVTPEGSPTASWETIKEISYNGQLLQIPVIKTSQKSTIVYTDIGYAYCKIPLKMQFTNPRFKLNELSAAVDYDNVYLKVKYTSPINTFFAIRLAGDAPGLKEVNLNKTKIGNNTAIVRLSKNKVKQYTDKICIEVGDDKSIGIDKSLTDLLAEIQVSKKLLDSTCIRLKGRLIPYANESGYPYTDSKGNIMAPFSSTMEALGAKTSLDGEKGYAIATKNKIEIEIPIGKKYIIKNGVQIKCNTETVITDGKIYIPLKTVVEGFGSKLTVNKSMGVIDIT